MITGFHHFSIIASSEASVAFYEKLGFSEYFRKERNYDTVVLMRGNGAEIEMFIDPNHPPRATGPENLGLRHVALTVDSVEETAAQLGLKIDKIMNDWTGVRFAFFLDPGGVPVELREQTKV